MTNPKRSWSLRRYLVAGVLVWLPILATLWVISFIVGLMDSILPRLPTRYQPLALIGFRLPGFGIVVALVVLLTTGVIVSNLIGKRLLPFWERVNRPLPVAVLGHGGGR